MDTTSLSSATRTTVGEIQRLSRAQGVNQVELANGQRDTRLAVFAQISSFSLSDRASDLASTKNDITSALSTVEAASAGLDAIGQTLDQARAIADQYERSDDATERARLQQNFDEISRQIDSLAADSGIGGVNLIAGQGSGGASDLTVSYRQGGSGSLSIGGQASDSAGLSLGLSVASVDAARAQIRDTAASFGTSASALSTRADFTQTLRDTLETGAAGLVESDLNRDGAEALALDTRTRLAASSLSIAAGSERAVTQLF